MRQSKHFGGPEYELVRKHFVALGKLDPDARPTLTVLGDLANPGASRPNSSHAVRAFARFLETGVDRRREKFGGVAPAATPGLLARPVDKPELNQYSDRQFALNVARAQAAQPHIVPALAGFGVKEHQYEYEIEDTE